MRFRNILRNVLETSNWRETNSEAQPSTLNNNNSMYKGRNVAPLDAAVWLIGHNKICNNTDVLYWLHKNIVPKSLYPTRHGNLSDPRVAEFWFYFLPLFTKNFFLYYLSWINNWYMYLDSLLTHTAGFFSVVKSIYICLAFLNLTECYQLSSNTFFSLLWEARTVLFLNSFLKRFTNILVVQIIKLFRVQFGINKH